MKLTLSLLFLLLCYFSFSQNLVMNGSFEETENCPKTYSEFNRNVKDWLVLTEGTPDLFSSCDKNSPFSTPNNIFGWQKAYDGNQYAGIITFGKNDYREYLTGKLNEKLIKGKEYKISFYISLAETSSLKVNSIGVLMSSEDTFFKTSNYLEIDETGIIINKSNIDVEKEIKLDSLARYIDFTNELYYDNQKEWIELQFSFIANGNEKIITIGNFENNTRTKFKKTRKRTQDVNSYYYIDNVSITATDNNLQETTNFTELNVNYSFKNIRFKHNSAMLIENSLSELTNLVDQLKKDSALNITISGHSDNIGSKEFNLKLSNLRAQSVAKYIINQGVSKHRVTTIGYGDTQPLNTENTEEARAENRRVEFKLAN